MEKRFYNYAKLIIDNIEGGYYSPTRHYNSAMGKSGETMFGMDRLWGGTVVNDSAPGKKFWKIVDANSSGWSYNSKGGKNESELKKLAAEIMGISYDKYFKQYLSSKAQKLVSKSPKLETHFFYACWNGVGRFKDFATVINNAVKNGTTNLEKLEKIAIDSRLNHSVSLLRKGGDIMQKKIWPKLPKNQTLIPIVVISSGIVTVGVVGWIGYKKGWWEKVVKKIRG